jgi:CDP-diacylglycerol--serine O-phosphatidyltransferase
MFKRKNPRMRKLRFQRPKLERPAMNRLIPNMITVAALCAGMTGIRFALNGEWQSAVAAVLIAAVLDGLDGRIARLLNATSKFGAELDSLSDFLAFGVAPAVIVYMWSVNLLGGFGWAVCLLLAVCAALRLARFNTALGDPNPPQWTRNYFTGIPAPAGALLALLPMIATFQLGGDAWTSGPWFNALWVLLVGCGMVSRIPTFSAKKVHLPPALMLPALLGVGILAVAISSAPWLTVLVGGVLYILTIPIAWFVQRHERERALMMPMPMPSLPIVDSVEDREDRAQH